MKILSPKSGFPAWGSNKETRNPQGIWLWRPMRFDYRTSTALGETDFTLGGHKQNLACTKTQGKGAVILQEPEPDLTASVGGFPVEVRVGRGSPQGCSHWEQQSWKVPLGVSPFGGHHLPYNRAHRPQGWVISGQTTNREGAQPHPSASNWIKPLLIKALPTRTRISFSP